MTNSITDIECKLAAAGHKVERTREAGSDPRTALSDSQWVFKVDGEVVATGSAIGVFEENVRMWLAGKGQAAKSAS